MPQDPAATVQTTPRSRSSTGTPGRLLAQLPDLSVEELETLVEEHIAASDGRMISQSLASKFVVGGGILLVVAALLPFTMARKTQPKPVGNDLARWHSTPVPEADVAPGWNGSSGQTADQNSSGGPTGPQGSIVVEAIPAGLGGNVHAPTWAEGAQGSLAAGSPAGGNNAAAPNLPTQIPPSGVSPGFPAGGDRAAQAVEANRPTALSRSGSGDQRPGADGRQDGTAQAAVPPIGPAGDRPVYQADARNDPANAYRAENRNSPSPAVSPVMPDPNREVAPADPGAPPPPPPTDLSPTQPSAASQQPPPPLDTAQLDPIVPLPSTQDHP